MISSLKQSSYSFILFHSTFSKTKKVYALEKTSNQIGQGEAVTRVRKTQTIEFSLKKKLTYYQRPKQIKEPVETTESNLSFEFFFNNLFFSI